MANRLHLTKLQDGEEIIFGPASQVQESTLSVKAEDDSKRMTHTSFRTVCVTNKRIIIETGDSHIHFPNNDIKRIIINRNLNKKKEIVSFNLMKAKTKKGNLVKLEIPNILTKNETLMAETFPNAVIEEERGLAKFLGRLLGE